MKKKDNWDKAAEDLKCQVLPKTINLHSMTVREIEFSSEPEFASIDGYTTDIIRSQTVKTFVLFDVANNMEVKITLKEHHSYL
jgi:hypothetical protein